MSRHAESQAWFRQLWPWLLMLPPLAAVVGGVTMIWLATHTPAPLVVDDYARIEELTAARFARDELAAVNGIAATARLDRSEPGATRVAVTLTSAELPDFLVLRFRHATDAQLDREVEARRDAAEYRSRVELLEGSYVLEIEPPDSAWRLATRLRSTDRFVELRAGALDP